MRLLPHRPPRPAVALALALACLLACEARPLAAGGGPRARDDDDAAVLVSCRMRRAQQARPHARQMPACHAGTPAASRPSTYAAGSAAPSVDIGDCAAVLPAVLLDGCPPARHTGGAAQAQAATLCGLAHSTEALLAVLQARGVPIAFLQLPGTRPLALTEPARSGGGSRLAPLSPEEAYRGEALARASVKAAAAIVAAMQRQGQQPGLPEPPRCEQCLWRLFVARLQVVKLGGQGGGQQQQQQQQQREQQEQPAIDLAAERLHRAASTSAAAEEAGARPSPEAAGEGFDLFQLVQGEAAAAEADLAAADAARPAAASRRAS
jgi:hypothetical protein